MPDLSSLMLRVRENVMKIVPGLGTGSAGLHRSAKLDVTVWFRNICNASHAGIASVNTIGYKQHASGLRNNAGQCCQVDVHLHHMTCHAGA